MLLSAIEGFFYILVIIFELWFVAKSSNALKQLLLFIQEILAPLNGLHAFL